MAGTACICTAPTLFRTEGLSLRYAMGSCLSRSAAHQHLTSAFTPLACVEVQLIMQFLDALSLLRLARCERRLLTDSRDEFAWRHARGVPLDIGPLLQALPDGSMNRRLPRTFHVPVRLCAQSFRRVHPRFGARRSAGAAAARGACRL